MTIVSALLSFILCPVVLPADTSADAVLGQPDMVSNDPNQPAGAPTASNMIFFFAPDVAIAPSGRLYLTDDGNHRVLSWPSAAAYMDGDAADLLIGQPDFTAGTENSGGAVSASGFFLPQGLAVESDGDLWVTDAFNHRVLRFDNPEANDTVADAVLGQLDFASDDQNLGMGEVASTAASMNFPGRVLAVEGGIFVADSGNSRILFFADPITSLASATHVFGQFNDFTAPIKNNDGSGLCTNVAEDPCGPPSAQNLFNPIGLAIDRFGSLYVADWINNRVLRYDNALTSDAVADAVYGQPSLDTGDVNDGGLMFGLQLPTDVAVDHFGRVYIVDSNNHRVVVYPPVAAGAVAPAPFAIFGQLGDFLFNEINHGQGPSMPDADGLSGPAGIALDAAENVYIVDAANSRTLRFDLPLPAPIPADLDFDADIDDADVSGWIACMTGPSGGVSTMSCLSADIEADVDVDLLDAARLIRCYSGSDQVPGAECLP